MAGPLETVKEEEEGNEEAEESGGKEAKETRWLSVEEEGGTAEEQRAQGNEDRKQQPVVVDEGLTLDEWEDITKKTKRQEEGEGERDEREQGPADESREAEWTFEAFVKAIAPGLEAGKRVYNLREKLLGYACVSSQRLQEDIKRVESCAKCKPDGAGRGERAAFEAIYEKLTRHKCPGTVGHHWERIGFQGSDPSTDLRGPGALGLLHLVHYSVVRTGHARRLLELSKREGSDFPLAAISINMSAVALKALSHRRLDLEALWQEGALEATCRLHYALMEALRETWQRQGLTVRDAARVRAHLESQALSPIGVRKLLWRAGK